MDCVQTCPSAHATPSVIDGTGLCAKCPSGCSACSDASTCIECVSSVEVVVQGSCIPGNCQNCVNCSETENACLQCA